MKTLLLLFVAVLLINCSINEPKEKSLNKIVYDDIVTGRVGIYGNEPFTWIGIKSSDETVYRVFGDSSLLNELNNMQGALVTVKGLIGEFMGLPKIDIIGIL